MPNLGPFTPEGTASPPASSQCCTGYWLAGKLYFVAKVKIVPGALITFASWWGIGQNLANYYPEGDADREFEIWASLKFIGPKFGSETKDGKNRMVCDRLFLVDKNGKKYKGETE